MGVLYPIGHDDVNSYVPVLSLYDVLAGAYIIQLPWGLLKQLVAVPADVYPDGHEPSDIVIYDSVIATYPDGHDVDGAAAKITPGTNTKYKTTNFFMIIFPCIF